MLCLIGDKARGLSPECLYSLFDSEYRVDAVRALRSIKGLDDRGWDALAAALEAKSSETEKACFLIFYLGLGAGQLEAILQQLVGSSERMDEVQLAATAVLAKFRPNARRQLPLLIYALRNCGFELRLLACEALGYLGTDAQDCVPIIERTMDRLPAAFMQRAEAIERTCILRISGRLGKDLE